MATGLPATTEQASGSAQQPGDEGLRGSMGVWSIVFMVLACMSPLTGAAGYVALVIAGGNGIGAPFMFLSVGAVMLVFAVGYVALVRRVARPGAFYAYVTEGLGKRVGLGGAFLTVVTYLLAEIGLLVFAGISLSWIISGMLGGPELAWWVCSIPFLLVAGGLSFLNVAVSARFLGFILVVELVLVLGYDLVVALDGGPEGLSTSSFTFDALSSGSMPLAFLFALTLFSGWESTALYYEEIRDPQHNIAKATYTIVGVVAIFYVLTSWMLITGYGAGQAYDAIAADYSSAFVMSVNEYLGKALGDVVNVFLVTGILASVLSMNNMLSRYIYSLGVDGVLPAGLGKADPRFGSPSRASTLVTLVLAASLVSIVIAGTDANSVLALSSGSGTYGFLFMFLLATASIFLHFVRNPASSKGYQIAVLGSALISLSIFAVMLGYVALNLDLIVGDLPLLTVGLQVLVYATFASGVLFASYLAVARRRVFDSIGRQDFLGESDLPLPIVHGHHH